MEHRSLITDDFAVKLMKLQSTGGIKSKEEVKQRVLDIANFLGGFMIASHLSDYNRRFSRYLKKFDSGIVDVVSELTEEKKTRIFNTAGSNWLISTLSLNSFAKQKAEISGLSLFEAEDAVLSMMVTNGRAHHGMPRQATARK